MITIPIKKYEIPILKKGIKKDRYQDITLYFKSLRPIADDKYPKRLFYLKDDEIVMEFNFETDRTYLYYRYTDFLIFFGNNKDFDLMRFTTQTLFETNFRLYPKYTISVDGSIWEKITI